MTGDVKGAGLCDIMRHPLPLKQLEHLSGYGKADTCTSSSSHRPCNYIVCVHTSGLHVMAHLITHHQLLYLQVNEEC